LPPRDIAHARPIQAFDQGRELRGRQAHDPVLDLRPAERAFLQPFGEQAQPRAIPDDQLDSIGALGTEHKDRVQKGTIVSDGDTERSRGAAAAKAHSRVRRCRQQSANAAQRLAAIM
jgi:hypothetical protein